jgi:hypothetical protein
MRSKRSILLAIIVFIGFLLLVTVALKIQQIPDESNNTTVINSTVPFKVYRPSNLPNGYIAEKDYTVSNGDIISFSIKTPSGSKAVITQQARPAEISSSSFSGLRINTPVGKATISSNAESASAAVITDADTLILINFTSSSNESEIKTILSSL